MSTEAKKLGRREFIKQAAVIGATAAAAGVLAGNLDVRPASAAEVKWDKEADVVVVGFGGAGGAAALEAAKAGAKTLVLERAKQGGGSTAICGGVVYMGGGTPLQKELGFTKDTRDAMFKYLMAAGQDGTDSDIVGLICDKSLELYDWMTGIGIKFPKVFHAKWPEPTPAGGYGLYYSGDEEQADYASTVPAAPRGHTTQNGGIDIFKPLQAAVEKAGAEIAYEALGKRLVVDANGRVVGVVAAIGGKEVNIKANRGVILTAGGFAANKQMVAAHCPEFLGCAANLGTPGDDGSGIRMGQAVGADTRMMGMAAGFKVITGSATVKGILVNQQGVRYMAEDHYFSWPADAIIRTYPISYLILDGGIWKELGEAGQKAAVVVQKADTLADLGKALKMVPGLLENTVNFYNQGAAKSQDPQFGKFKDYMQTLMTPPYYALDASAKGIVFFTTGGLRTNLKAQVLDASGASAGRPIPGLYAAGRNAFGLIGYRYQGSGSSVADALTFGRVAGQNAAAEKPGV